MFGKKDEGMKFSNPFAKKKSASETITESAKKVVPGFQDEPACAKCCPKLTFKQVI
jgi:hypothetical protein